MYELVEEIYNIEKNKYESARVIYTYTKEDMTVNGRIREFGTESFSPYNHTNECMKSDIANEIIYNSEYVIVNDYYIDSKACEISDAPRHIMYTMRKSNGQSIYAMTLQEAIDYYNSSIEADNIKYVKSVIFYNRYDCAIMQILYYDCTHYGEAYHRKQIVPILENIEPTIEYFENRIEEEIRKDRISFLEMPYFHAEYTKVV